MSYLYMFKANDTYDYLFFKLFSESSTIFLQNETILSLPLRVLSPLHSFIHLSSCRPTRCVAIDCEMVGAGHGGRNNILARVSVVNQYGYCLYDKFVRSREDVTDYRTWVSGVRKKDLDHGKVSSEVSVNNLKCMLF